MTNTLVGDVYAKIIEDVITASANDFEESGVSGSTLQELQQEWQAKLSLRNVAQMPWDPKPAPPAPVQAPNPANGLPSAANGVQQSYSYDGQQQQTPQQPAQNGVNGNGIKAEPGTEQWQGMPNGYPQASAPPPQGGLARAQQLVQQYGGQGANGTPIPMQQQQQQQQQRGGLALPAQQPRPQGLQLPGQGMQQPQQQMSQNPQQIQQAQQHYAQQQQMQQQQMLQRQQQMVAQQAQQQQQAQPTVKVEGGAQQPQQASNPSYTQTDGADDDLAEWQNMLAQRRAAGAEAMQHADRMMRNQTMEITLELENGLMMPMDDKPKRNKRKVKSTRAEGVPQLDGDADDDDEKPDVKDEDDEDAINSDLDDSDDDGQGNMGDDDDELGDSILCTYDKVQRVKNKWKCTLKDGVMSVGGKEWVFHKGTGEYEW